MEDNFILHGLFTLAVTGIIVPLVDWLQTRVLPLDFPIRQVVFVFGLCLLSAWGLAAWLNPLATWKDILTYTLAQQVFAQVIDAGRKTKKEIVHGPNN